MKKLQKLHAIFSSPKYGVVFLATTIVFGAIIAVTSDIIIFPSLQLNPIAQPLQIGIISIIVFLLAANTSVLVQNFDLRKDTGGKTTTLFGTAAAFFTTACPVCQPIWLVWIGAGSATAFLSDVSILIGIASIAMLLFSLNILLKEDFCEVK